MQAEADEQRGRRERELDWEPLLRGFRKPIRIVLIVCVLWVVWRLWRR
jgi:hypothetical protein